MKFEKYILPNGLRVILAPLQHTETVTVLFLVGTGSRYETRKNNGVSHFLEHLAFKGTKKRPRPKDITAEIDAVGGEINAFTSKEYTGYWNKVNFKHLPLALDLVSDITLNLTLPPKEIEKERGVILEEINMYEDLPMQKVLRNWEEVLFGDQPLGWEPLGKKEIIQKISRAEISRYWQRQYKAQNSILVLAGNFSAIKNIKEEIKKYFGRVSQGNPKKKTPLVAKSKDNVSLAFKETDQTHLVVGFETCGLDGEKERWPLGVLAALLGGYMSARLFQEIREKRGWAYYIHAYADFYTDVGFLAGRAGVLNKVAEKAVEVVLKEFKKIKEGKFKQAELEVAKNNIIGKISLNLEETSSIAEFLAEQELLKKRILTPDEIFDKIKAVTKGDLEKVARRYFVNRGLSLALIGPHKNEAKFKQILKI